LIYDGVKPYDIGDYLDVFLEGAQTPDDFEKDFKEALVVAQDILRREITRAQRQVRDWNDVRKIYEESPDKRIITLSLNKSWKEILVPSEALYVIFPRPDGQWSARAIPKAHGSYELKKPMPEVWAGLRGEELARVSGVP